MRTIIDGIWDNYSSAEAAEAEAHIGDIKLLLTVKPPKRKFLGLADNVHIKINAYEKEEIFNNVICYAKCETKNLLFIANGRIWCVDDLLYADDLLAELRELV